MLPVRTTKAMRRMLRFYEADFGLRPRPSSTIPTRLTVSRGSSTAGSSGRQIIVVPANLTSRPQEVVQALGRSGLYFRRTWEQVSTVREICGNESWFAFRRGGVQCEW